MWEPGEDYFVRMDDCTAEKRTEEQLREMVSDIKMVANKYGFDINCYGGWIGGRKVALGETGLMILGPLGS
jgi:hypothetical protein